MFTIFVYLIQYCDFITELICINGSQAFSIIILVNIPFIPLIIDAYFLIRDYKIIDKYSLSVQFMFRSD